MSDSGTNVKTKIDRHQPALAGIVFALIAAVIAAFATTYFIDIPVEEQATPVPTTSQDAQ